jgi:protein TonB
MFEGFQRKTDHHARRRFAFSTGASLVLYGLVGVAVVWAASKPEPAQAPDESVAVTFQPMPEAPPPAPPPPPPAVPADMKVKRVKTPRPVEPLRAPEEVPAEPLPEAEPTNDAVEVADGTAGEAGGVEGGTAAPPAPPPPAPPPPKPTRADPINLPEQATPPVAADDNRQPDYPAEARAKGLEGQVILKIVVSESGAVTRVEVLRGDEPFAAAAMAAVKTWRYSPALVEGRPTAVFRIVKIPFRIKS